MPYMIAWMLYQGTLLMSMLNWTGLVINGLVAFILPMILALKSTEQRQKRAKGVELTVQVDTMSALQHFKQHFDEEEQQEKQENNVNIDVVVIRDEEEQVDKLMKDNVLSTGSTLSGWFMFYICY